MRILILAALAAFSLSAQSNAPMIIGADGKYLGRLSSNHWDSDSVSNTWGRYGNPWSSDSINNSWGKYGNPWSSYSPGGTVTVTPSAPVLMPPMPAVDIDYSYLRGPAYRPQPVRPLNRYRRCCR